MEIRRRMCAAVRVDWGVKLVTREKPRNRDAHGGRHPASRGGYLSRRYLPTILFVALIPLLLFAGAAQAVDGPTAPILDTFNRANEDPLAQWGNWSGSIDGQGQTLEILSNVAGHNDGQGVLADSYRPGTVSGNAEVYATIAGFPGNDREMYLYLHLQQAGTSGFDGYRMRLYHWITTDRFYLERVDNGVATNLAGPLSLEPAGGDTLFLLRSGNTLELRRQNGGVWTSLLTASDATYQSGSIGFGMSDDGGAWDDFGGSGPPPSQEPPPPNLPQTTVADNFNRPNEDPLAQAGAWSSTHVSGSGETLEVLSNAAGQNEGDFTNVQSYRTAELSGDVEVYATIAAFPENNQEMVMHLHLQDVGTPGWDGYRMRWYHWITTDTFAIQRIDNGVATGLVGVSMEPAGGDTLLLRRVDDTLELWRKNSGSWAKVLSTADATYQSGRLGLGMDDENGRWDDFGGGETGSGGPPSGPPPPEQCYGVVEETGVWGHCGSGTLSDPVNTLTGSFVTQVQDLSLPGTALTLDWTRSYTSGDPTVGPLGPGWTHSYAAQLTIEGDGDVTARGEEGQELFFSRQQDGSYVGAAGALVSLSLSGGVYTLVRNDQVSYTFDSQGALTSIKDRNNQGLTFAYTSGRLTMVTDAAGRDATVSYNGSNLVSQVTLEDGRSVSYGYTSGRLTSVTDVRGKTWTYTYDGGGRLATIVDPLNHTQVTNVYGTDGRVTSQTDALNKTTTFAWDEGTQTATVTDPRNHVWKDVYVDGVLLRRIDALNNTTEFGRDADLNETSVKSATNEQTTMTYDANGNLLTATAPPSMGSVQKTFAYNAKNDPTQVTDARGTVTTYGYDGSGNTTSVTQDGQQVASYTYDAQGHVLTSTDGNGKTTTYGYDANGNVTSVTEPDPDGAGPLPAPVTTYTYDARGFMLTQVDPLGNVPGGNPSQYTTTFTYNAAGQLLTETDPLGHVTTNVYDDAGRLTSVTDASNHTTSYTYDNANRLLTETGPDPDGGGPLQAPVTSYSYDDAGNKLTETDPRGNTTTYTYDDADRLVSETGPDPDGAGPLTAPVTTYTYDANGNLASVVEPRGNVQGANPNDYRTTYTYDAAGRLLTTTDPLGNVTTNVYDPVGNLASVTDSNNHQTSHTYDAKGRMVTLTAPDPDGGGPLTAPVTSYTYDGNGNVLTRTDANNHTTTYGYDGLSRLVSETGPDPDGGGPQAAAVTTYAYDANGNRTSMTDPNGNATPTPGDGTTTYGYDRANRLTSIDYSDSTPDVTLTLDDVGNRLSMVDGLTGTQTWTYDALDRLLTVTRGTSTFSYQYDAAGNVTKRTYPDGTVVDYTYDPLGRMATAINGTKTVTHDYDAASNLVQTTLPSQNGYVETRVYDRAGRLNQVKSVKGGTTLVDVTYARDPMGNPLTETTTGTSPVTKTLGYDNMDRLTSVCFQTGSCPGGSDPFIRWTYDGVGNRLSEQRPAGTTSYTYDARDRLLSAGSTSYTYDQNGNELSEGSRTFTYDLANRLKTTTLSPTTTTYTYDGDGIRTQASTGTTNQSKTNFTWDLNQELPQIVREASGANALYRRYFYGIDLMWMSTLENNSNAFYFHHDPLGSVRAITAQGGATQRTYDYEPYGVTRAQTGSSPTNLMKFAGEYEDPTGLYHLRARQYEPSLGRFIQVDPEQPNPNSALINAYSYAANRPILFIDPTGATPQINDDFEAAMAYSTSPIASGAAACPKRTVAQREKCAFDFFVARGLTKVQSAGCVGNLWWESGRTLNPRQWQLFCKPHNWHDSNCGIGIAQWTTKGRKEGLLKFAGSRKRALTFEVQLAFVWRELKTGVGPAFPSALEDLQAVKGKNRAAVNRATRIFMRKYENPGVPHLSERQQEAWKVFTRYR